MDIRVRKAIPFEEVDTTTLRQALSEYASPDDKIGDMVRQGELLRLRRGLYAVAPAYRRGLLSLEFSPTASTAHPICRIEGVRALVVWHDTRTHDRVDIRLPWTLQIVRD